MGLVLCEFKQVAWGGNDDRPSWKSPIFILTYDNAEDAQKAAILLSDDIAKIASRARGDDEIDASYLSPFDDVAFMADGNQIKIAFEEGMHLESDAPNGIRVIMERLADQDLSPSHISMTGWGDECFGQLVTLYAYNLDSLVHQLGQFPAELYQEFFVTESDPTTGSITFALREMGLPGNQISGTSLASKEDIRRIAFRDTDLLWDGDNHLVAVNPNYAHPPSKLQR